MSTRKISSALQGKDLRLARVSARGLYCVRTPPPLILLVFPVSLQELSCTDFLSDSRPMRYHFSHEDTDHPFTRGAFRQTEQAVQLESGSGKRLSATGEPHLAQQTREAGRIDRLGDITESCGRAKKERILLISKNIRTGVSWEKGYAPWTKVHGTRSQSNPSSR